MGVASQVDLYWLGWVDLVGGNSGKGVTRDFTRLKCISAETMLLRRDWAAGGLSCLAAPGQAIR